MGVPELIAVAMFLWVVTIVAGSYYLFVVRPEGIVQDVLRQRIRTGGGAAVRATGGGLLKEVDRLSVFGPLHTVLSGDNVAAKRLRHALHQSGLKVTGGQLVLGSACLALMAHLAVTVFWFFPAWLGALVGLLAGSVPYLIVKWLGTRRLNEFEEQFPEAVALLARTLRAGHAFTTGLRFAADELPEPVAGEFKLLHDQQTFGLPLIDGLKGLAERVPIIDARFFVTAVLTQMESGGNLSEVLDNLGAVIRDRFKTKRQLRVLTAHGRITGLVLAALPPALAGYLLIRTPDHFRVLIDEPIGHQMIAVALALQVLGGYLIYKISNIEYEPMEFEALMTLVFVFVSVAFLTIAGMSLLTSRPSIGRRRLNTLVLPRASGVLVAPKIATLSGVLDPQEDRLTRLLPTSFGTTKRLRRELALAGFYGARDAAWFSVAEMVCPILLAVPPIFLLQGVSRWLVAGMGAFVGYLGPSVLLKRRVTRRQKEIQNGLADALDLLVLCLEAGLSLDQAIVKAGEELGVAYPALGDQLHIMIVEMRAGKARLDAFRGLAERTGVDDVRALVSMLVQTDRFGTSIVQALRTHADVCRTKRRQRAEERAQKVGVKLVFPLVFCLFPALYVVLLGPAYIKFMKVFAP